MRSNGKQTIIDLEQYIQLYLNEGIRKRHCKIY